MSYQRPSSSIMHPHDPFTPRHFGSESLIQTDEITTTSRCYLVLKIF